MNLLGFYLLGAAVTFCMMLFIFLKTRPWDEDDGQPNDKRTTIGVILSCIIAISIFSLFSWVTVTYLLVKRVLEIRNGI